MATVKKMVVVFSAYTLALLICYFSVKCGAVDSFFKSKETDVCDGEDCIPTEKYVENKQVPAALKDMEDEQVQAALKDVGNEQVPAALNAGLDEHINIMITFYNAKSNSKLIKTFTATVKSLLEHSSVPLVIHIIGDEKSQDLATNILRENNGRNKTYQVEKLDVDTLAKELEEIVKPMQELFSYKTGSYYNHALFFLSIAMHKVMPPSMKKVIMLDADLKFMDDVKKLHDRFRLFHTDTIIGIGRDLQPVYRHTFFRYRSEHPGTRVGDPPPNGLTGFNSGVLLLDLDKMRESKLYNNLISAEHVKRLSEEFLFKGHLGDQDFFTLVSMRYEWLFHVLPCTWNRQLCQWWKDHGYKDVFDQYFNCEGDVKIYHGNCGTPIPE